MTRYLNIISEISFANPEMFLLFILIFGNILWYIYRRNTIYNSIKFSNINLFSKEKSLKQKIFHLPYALKIISGSLLIIALARPQTEEKSDSISKEGIHIAMVMDISPSMLACDLVKDDPSISRADITKRIAIDFIKKRKGDNICLVFFNSKTSIPIITTNYNYLIKEIKTRMSADQPGGTAIGDALNQAILPLIDIKSKSKVIILITDGTETDGRSSAIDAALNARNLKEKIKIYTIGIGSKQKTVPFPELQQRYDGSPILTENGRFIFTGRTMHRQIGSVNETLLQKIADTTEGKYFYAKNEAELQSIYNEINKLEKIEILEESFTIKKEEYYSIVLLSIIIYLCGILIQLTYLRKIP